MAEGLNRVMLLGNLGADPELRFTQGGQAVLNLRLATTESYLDRDKVRKERTDWHNVVIWGKRAEALGKILSKGSSIFVEGSLRTSSYDDRDGNKRYKTEVIANNVLLTGGGRGRGGGVADDAAGFGAGYGGEGAGFGGDAPGGGYGGGGGGGYGGGGGGAPGGGRPAGGGGAPGGGRPAGGGYNNRGGGRPAAPDPGPPADDFGGGYGGGGNDDDIPF
ncbi:single-stranded DNA-binding protein [Sorangium cellulosum]|uniref:Single-stranded DNA-binding protein n=1 Tax=Sorangium cellulosum TaxID=56 RepID=A0A2L0FA42_SORCE|nr:single-stranded DNA-binding protein [Sorangium cellulosum]AUX48362.1 single-stranded DNA-binding protein [Sorangium cellulosum]